MPDPYRSYRAGEPAPRDAATFNAFASAARMARDAGRPLSPGDEPGAARRADVVRVKNAAGTDLARHSILGIDAPLFLPADDENAFLREPAIRGVEPTSAHASAYVVLLEPALEDRVIRACVAGVCAARVDVTSTAHGYAVAKAGETGHLASAGIGPAQILWRESGTGVKWALVRLGAAPIGDVVGKITGSSIAAVSGSTESSGTVRIYSRSSSGVRSDSGVDVVAWNPSNTVLPVNAFVIVGLVDGLWTIKTRLDC